MSRYVSYQNSNIQSNPENPDLEEGVRKRDAVLVAIDPRDDWNEDVDDDSVNYQIIQNYEPGKNARIKLLGGNNPREAINMLGKFAESVIGAERVAPQIDCWFANAQKPNFYKQFELIGVQRILRPSQEVLRQLTLETKTHRYAKNVAPKVSFGSFFILVLIAVLYGVDIYNRRYDIGGGNDPGIVRNSNLIDAFILFFLTFLPFVFIKMSHTLIAATPWQRYQAKIYRSMATRAPLTYSIIDMEFKRDFLDQHRKNILIDPQTFSEQLSWLHDHCELIDHLLCESRSKDVSNGHEMVSHMLYTYFGRFGFKVPERMMNEVAPMNLSDDGAPQMLLQVEARTIKMSEVAPLLADSFVEQQLLEAQATADQFQPIARATPAWAIPKQEEEDYEILIPEFGHKEDGYVVENIAAPEELRTVNIPSSVPLVSDMESAARPAPQVRTDRVLELVRGNEKIIIPELRPYLFYGLVQKFMKWLHSSCDQHHRSFAVTALFHLIDNLLDHPHFQFCGQDVEQTESHRELLVRLFAFYSNQHQATREWHWDLENFQLNPWAREVFEKLSFRKQAMVIDHLAFSKNQDRFRLPRNEYDLRGAKYPVVCLFKLTLQQNAAAIKRIYHHHSEMSKTNMALTANHYDHVYQKLQKHRAKGCYSWHVFKDAAEQVTQGAQTKKSELNSRFQKK